MSSTGRIAAFSIDIEPDYGGRFGSSYRALNEGDELKKFREALHGAGIPVTLFITGKLLEENPGIASRMSEIGDELQVHSHSHPGPPHDVAGEALMAYRAFERFFGHPPTGYRSPFGFIRDEYLEQLADLGYRYDSSLFPTFRPGRFSNVNRSLFPERHSSGLWELPLGCFNIARLVFSAGYLKFFGPILFRLLLRLCGIPEILVIDSHMHDFIPTSHYRKLPLHARARYRRHKGDGTELLISQISLLRAYGFEFDTVSGIVDKLEKCRETWKPRVVRF